MTTHKTVRMLGGNTTEWNHSRFGIFTPRDDGSFAIPEAAVPDAMKAGLVVAELSESKKLRLALDQIHALKPSPHRTAILNASRDSQLAAWAAEQAADAAQA